MTTKKFILYLFLCWMACVLFYWYYAIASIDESDMLILKNIEIEELEETVEALYYLIGNK